MIIGHAMRAGQARMQNWESKHFEITKYGRKLNSIKDSHKSEHCFIIGNGPSLMPSDLQELHEIGIPCFGTNRVFKIFDQTDWRPTYYVSEDIIILRGIQKEVNEIPSEMKFIPINLKWYEYVDIKDATYFYMDYGADLSETFGLSINVPHCIRCRATVTTTCIQLAVHMGFSEIYLLGVDHNFAKMIDRNGNVVTNDFIRNHFTDDYDKDIIDQGFQIDGATEAYMNIERLSRKLGTFRVFNATRGGKLEAFERVSFDEVIRREK